MQTIHRVLIGLAIIIVLGIIVYFGYTSPAWSWVGVANPPKLLWDWLSALGITSALGGLIIGFVSTQKSAQQDSKVATYKEQVGSRFLSTASSNERQRQALALIASVLPSID